MGSVIPFDFDGSAIRKHGRYESCGTTGLPGDVPDFSLRLNPRCTTPGEGALFGSVFIGVRVAAINLRMRSKNEACSGSGLLISANRF
ncbi:hypothetical protein [Desulfovibrio oxyclinae]|uniref:hypothetical protein n=1 Tax=Desulfovibrio oxyclinae TaxID=63560 RepID=UPI000A044F62|nr:hypothetical protein [Desulfovibrio oxyclinae]